MAAHRFEHMVRASLDRDIEIMGDAPRIPDRLDELVARFRRDKDRGAGSSRSRGLLKPLTSRRYWAFCPLKVKAITGGILADERNLFDPFGLQLLRFGDDLIEGSGNEMAPDIRESRRKRR
jgi:hypothetical protein